MVEDPPLLTVARNITRPSEAQVAAFRGVPTGNIVDAMDGRGALDYSIKPLIDEQRYAFCGVALTSTNGPDDNLGALAALALAQKGDVMVASAEGFTRSAVTGDLMLGMMKNIGVVAFVTDGMVRDIDGLLKVGVPVYSSGVTPNSPVKNGPGTVGLPIALGGVAIASGDIVVGDRDGVVIVPRARIDQVIARLAQVRTAEAGLEAKVKAGLKVPDAIQALLKSDRTRWVD
jgi:4-hydroxy-4-methyl-2-oxoglutarate aldolase